MRGTQCFTGVIMVIMIKLADFSREFGDFLLRDEEVIKLDLRSSSQTWLPYFFLDWPLTLVVISSFAWWLNTDVAFFVCCQSPAWVWRGDLIEGLTARTKYAFKSRWCCRPSCHVPTTESNSWLLRSVEFTRAETVQKQALKRRKGSISAWLGEAARGKIGQCQ